LPEEKNIILHLIVFFKKNMVGAWSVESSKRKEKKG
jgi:hypothetical protein